MKLRPSTSTIGRLGIVAVATAGLALGVACSAGGSSDNSSSPFAGGAFMGAPPSPAAPVARGSAEGPSRVADAIAAASSQAQAGNRAQAKGIDPCHLVTREEVNAAVG